MRFFRRAATGRAARRRGLVAGETRLVSLTLCFCVIPVFPMLAACALKEGLQAGEEVGSKENDAPRLDTS
jgi:hypothetical protein